jgi:PAS domain S-box-containing protein
MDTLSQHDNLESGAALDPWGGLGATALGDALPLAVAACDPNLRLIGWNAAAEETFGWTASEVLGRRYTDVLIPEAERPATEARIRAFLESEELLSDCLAENLTRDGRYILCEWKRRVVRDSSGRPLLLTGIARDVSRERQNAQVQDRLHEIVVAANESRDLYEILLLVRSAMLEVGGFDRVGVWLLGDDMLTGAWGTDMHGELKDERGLTVPHDAFSRVMSDVICGRRPFAVSSSVLFSVGGQSSPPAGSPVFACIGLFARGEPIGMIFVDNRISGRTMDEGEIAALLPFCEQVALAVSNARLLDERARLVERQRRLMQISAAISGSRDLDLVLRMVRDALVEAGGFDRAGVWLVQGTTLRGSWGTDSSGALRDERHLREDLGDWAPGVNRLLNGSAPFLIEDYAWLDATETIDEPAFPHGLIAMRAGGDTVGLISVDNLLSGRMVDARDISPLLPFAEQAAVAIRNAQLTRERDRLRDRERRLLDISAAISASLDLDQVLRLVRDAAVEAGGFDRAGVWLLDGDEIQGTWGTDIEGNVRDEHACRVPFNEGPEVERLLDSESPFLIQTSRSEDLVRAGRGAEIEHAVIVLRAGAEVVGVLSVDNAVSNRRVSAEEVGLLLPFAQQAAVAIRNARLLEQLARAQDALIRAEKMRALGELASGVAHNINNLLTAVLGYSELIRSMPGVPPQVAQYARVIERAGLDGAEIVRRVQQFARQEASSSPTRFYLASVVAESVAMTRPVWYNDARSRGVEIQVVEAHEPGIPILGAPTELREVVMNLIKNAVEAMPSGGTISVRTRRDGLFGRVEVRDTGVGMDEATRRRVFEPFFTTKGPTLGSGLGLPLAWGVMQRHKGRIEVESEPGRGSCFTLILPLDNADSPAAARQQAAAFRPLAGLRLLLVEDEEMVAESMARMLIASGAQVEAVDNAEEALFWLKDHSDCDAVVSDHGLPGMNGLQLLGIVREQFPGMARVLVSGWGADPPGAEDHSPAEVMLAKPVPHQILDEALLRLVRR